MRRQLDMIGSHRRWLGLVGVSALALLPGCGMFDGGGPPPQSLRERPGADRQVAASNALRSAPSGRQYESGIAPVDETRGGPRIGSIVAGLGGQKVQKEALEKQASERDAKDREQRQARATAEKEAKAREPAQPPARAAPVAPSDGAPPSEQAAVAPPAPVSTAPIAPVAAEPAPIAQPVAQSPAPVPAVAAAEPPTPAPAPVPVAAAPARPANPDKAFEPPPGWAPPGQTAVPADASTFIVPASTAPTSIAPVPVVAAEPPTPAPAPMTVAAAPARPANPNKAFEPPPGWAPPGQTAAPVVAAEPPTPAPAPVTVAAAPARPANPNKAFEPPPGWAPPGQTTAPVVAAEPPTPAPAPVTVAAAAARPANPNKAFEPPPGWVPPGQPAAPAVASIAPAQPVAPPAPQAEPATPAPVDQVQTVTIDFAGQAIELSAAMKAELARVARKSAGRIEVRSYFGGTDPDSRKISLARALIVRTYLIDQGVSSRTIEVGTFGAGAKGERVDVVASLAAQPAPAPASPPPATPAPPPVVTPAPQPEPATPAPANQALLGTIAFAGQSIELSDAMRAELDRVAKKFADRSPRQIEVRSYSGGTDLYSRQVSLARALIVRSYLIDRGLKARSIEVATFSADGAGAEGERVDILALGL